MSGTNYDGSRDYGCAQLNSRAQADFFVSNDWSDAEANVKRGYQIFQSRGNWSAWYAVCTPNRVPKFTGIWCGK